MSYNILIEDTTITASDINQNFSLAAGDLLPKGDDVLTITTDTYNIGSDSYKWKDVWAVNAKIKGSDIRDYWTLVTEIILSATTSQIDVTGLNGDEIEFLWITIKAVSTATIPSLFLHLNDDTATNYGYQNVKSFYIDHTTTAFGTNTAERTTADGILVGRTGYDSTTNLHSYSETYIHIGSENYKPAIVNLMASCVGHPEPYITEIYQIGACWNNSDTVTSLVVEASASTLRSNTSIQIWGRSRI